jgi:hypothetical protein
MRTYGRILLLSLIVLSALLVPTVPAKADAPFDHAVFFGRFTIDEPFDLVNPCSEEQILGTFKGQGHLLIVADGGGGAHLELLLVVHGRGETPDGTTYTVGGEVSQVVGATFLSDRRVLTAVGNVHFISAGGGDNFVVHVAEHLTITPDGTVTSEFVIISEECRG